MSFPVVQANYQDIDGVLWGWRWSSNQPNGHTLLTYSFPASASAYGGYTNVSGFEAFNAQQKTAGLKALAMFDAVCNVDLVFTADSAAANIRMAEADSVNVGTGTVTIGTALGVAPDPNFAPLFAQGDTWFNHDFYNAPAPGTFAFAAGIMHEIGHALGLKHGHLSQAVQDANGVVLHTNPALSFDHDSLEYTVMTYRSYPGAIPDAVPPREFPSTLMQNDILALQYLYGPNYDHNAGNTTYTWSPSSGQAFINGVGQGVPLHHKIFMTIWDGGGVDTYNFSNYRTNAVIDLAPGAWSTPSQNQRADLDAEHPGIHLARGSIANAQVFSGDLHGYIENAIGGRGNDTILGNIVGNALSGGGGSDLLFGLDGDDRLIGGAGNDLLTGGGGFDIFVFNTSLKANIDHVSEFAPGFDEIRLDRDVFRTIKAGTLSDEAFLTAAGANAAADRSDRIVYDPESGKLFYDSDGKGGEKAKLFAILDTSPGSLGAADFWVVS
jgi:serralysin